MNLEVNDQDVQLILAGLEKLPLGIAVATWGKVQNQLQEATAKASRDAYKARRSAEEEETRAKASKLNGEDRDVQELKSAEMQGGKT